MQIDTNSYNLNIRQSMEMNTNVLNSEKSEQTPPAGKVMLELKLP